MEQEQIGISFPRYCEHGDCTIVVAIVTIVGARGDTPFLRIRPTENRAPSRDPSLYICRAHIRREKKAHRRIYAYADVELTETTARLHVLCEEPGGGLFVMADEKRRACVRQGESDPALCRLAGQGILVALRASGRLWGLREAEYGSSLPLVWKADPRVSCG